MLPPALRYPAGTAIGAVAICLALAFFGNADEIAVLAVVVLIVAVWTTVRLVGARSGGETPRAIQVRRIRQQHRLVSRSWLEVRDGGRAYWLPVYFDPALVALTATPASGTSRSVDWNGHRFFAAGRSRSTEPVGRLIDNPSRIAPDAVVRGVAANRVGRRLLLDAQSAVGAPLVGFMWVFVAGGGIGAFAGATAVGAAAAIWWSAIGGSDPS
ncbi:hypothetical protein [Aldersonia kunmingensis]|uniref:hypothetical protein n=1 Tax=Aldersonia kunmingensis TaxID=408066 RepID=UPI000A90FE9F|nr:hypothetical protein [Aldersonia kunmingensis]